MRRMVAGILAAFVAGAALASWARAEEIKTAKGQTYRNATVTRTEPDGIVIMTDTGILKLPFTELTPELQRKYGYDVKRAAEYAKKAEAAQNRASEAASAARSAEAQRTTQAFAEMAKRTEAVEKARREAATVGRPGPLDEKAAPVGNARTVWEIRIAQTVDEGALAFIGEADEPILLRGIQSAADGDRLYNKTLYPCGMYRYDSVLGANKTVRAYALSAEAASKFNASR